MQDKSKFGQYSFLTELQKLIYLQSNNISLGDDLINKKKQSSKYFNKNKLLHKCYIHFHYIHQQQTFI